MKKLFSLLAVTLLVSVACKPNEPEAPPTGDDPVKLNAPVNLAIDPEDTTSSSIVLTWDEVDSDEVENYTVSYVLDGETTATEVDADENSRTITGLEAETTYVFKVKANSTEGSEYDSDWSATKSGTTKPASVEPLGIPQNLSAVEDASSSTQLGVEWDGVDDAVKYIVSYKAETDTEYTTSDSEDTEFVIDELTPGTKYYVKVQAVSGSETSDFSEEINFTTFTRSMGIYTAADFMDFAAGDADGGEWKNASGVVVIQRDIDMTDVEWIPIPEFTGTLDGNGKTIDNLTYTSADAEYVSLIAVLNGTVKNLTLGAGCAFESNRTVLPETAAQTTKTASFAGIMNSGVLENCINKAPIKAGMGSDFIGGIVAYSQSETEASITGCVNEGAVALAGNVPWTKNKQNVISIGGIVGQAEKGTFLSECVNKAIVSSANTDGGKAEIPLHIGGITGIAKEITIVACSTEASAGIKITDYPHRAYVGGINGYGHSVSFDRCISRGTFDITKEAREEVTEFMIGGIEGYFVKGIQTEVTVKGCYNYSDITFVNNPEPNKAINIGGVIGLVNSGDLKFEISDCHNEGDLDVTVTVSTSQMGGIVGKINNITGTHKIIGCSNKGTITSRINSDKAFHIGGILGASDCGLTIVDDCENSGDVYVYNTSRSYGSGVVGQIRGCTVTNCVNTGDIYVPLHASKVAQVGGVVSRTWNGGTISGCRNEGNIIYGGPSTDLAGANSAFGGVVGYLDKDNATIDDCTNVGTIIGDAGGLGNKGSICGLAAAEGPTTITNCKVGGALGNYNADATDFGVSAATALTAQDFNDHVYGAKINALTESGNVFSN